MAEHSNKKIWRYNMDEIFVQEYVNTLTKRVEDYVKNEILLTTRLALADKTIMSLLDQKAELEKIIIDLNSAKEIGKKKTIKNSDEF